MTVSPPVYDCSTSTARAIQDEFKFCIPKPGQERNEVIFDSSAGYFTAPAVGCRQQYSITILEGSTTYSEQSATGTFGNYYEIDTDGRVTFRNIGYRTVNDNIQVVVTSLGGPEPVVQYSETFKVVSECCAGSTEVLPPALATVDVAVNDQAKKDGAFSSSNNRCPVQSHALCPNTNTNNHFTLDDRGANGFEVTLRNTSTQTIGCYDYSVCSTALGGAVGRANG